MSRTVRMNALRIFVFFALIFLLTPVSTGSQLTFKAIAKLPEHIAQQVIAIAPVSKYQQHYLIAIATGELLILDANNDEATLTSLDNKFLGNSENSQLLAIALHPNFSIREQDGYHTFYSAHQVTTESAEATRIFDPQLEASAIKQDIIIQEWQLSEDIQLEESTSREVMRIGLPTKVTAQVQLAFNPYHKVWDDSFGILYIGLSAIEEFQSLPLYSGSILRIKPQQFGLKPYTVPPTNPYTNRDDINPEIFKLKLAKLSYFVWPDRANDTLWVDHLDQQSHRISQLSIPTATVHNYESLDVSAHQILPYYGRQTDILFGTTLVVSQLQGQTYLTSLTKPMSGGSYQLTPILPLASQTPVKLFNDTNGDALIYQPSSGVLSRLINEAAATANSETLVTSPNSGIEKLIVILMILSLSSWAFWLTFRKVKDKKLSITAYYQQQYSHLELSGDQKVLQLFKAQESVPTKSLPINGVDSIKLILNAITIAEFNQQRGMTNDLANIWRQACSVEKRQKMVTSKLRHIQMEISNKEGEVYSVSLYLRKGDSRISKASYQVAVANVIDWAWRLSQLIAPATTEQREQIKETEVIDKSRPIKARKLHFTKPSGSATSVTKDSTSAVNNTDSVTQKLPTKSQTKDSQAQVRDSQTQPNNVENDKVAQGQTDAQIILALEKLVKLKKQDFLTEEEFKQAKTKLLNGLM